MNLFLDVETVPSQAEDALELARATVRPPATFKKPESIAAWHASEGAAAAEETWRRQALDGGTQGEIVSIAIVDDTGREFARCRGRTDPADDEAALLRAAFAAVDVWTEDDGRSLMQGRGDAFPFDDHKPVAHNAAFDLGFLWRRCAVRDVPRPRWLPAPTARHGRDYYCTMIAWAGHGGRISLDALCRALGVRSPKADGTTGAHVFDLWLQGRTAEIADYNLRDAHAVREVYHRILGLPRQAAA